MVPTELMAEDQARKMPAVALPIFGEGLEANVLSEEYSIKICSSREELVVRELSTAIFDGCQDIDFSPSELVSDSQRNVDIHIESHWHREVLAVGLRRAQAQSDGHGAGCCRFLVG